jgi:hypothetical protein
MDGSWHRRVITRLVECKANGYRFEQAWHETLRLDPPWGRDRDPVTPALFDETGNVPETSTMFFKRVAEDAWYDRVGQPGSGRGPALRHFRVDLLMAEDESSPVYVRRAA